MPITTISAGQLARDPAQAKRAAKTGPVFVTEGGKSAFVMLTIVD